MSFQDLEGTSSKPSSGPESGRPAVAAGIFRINTAVAGFRRLVDAIGTSKDTPEHRQNLQEARRQIGQLVRETSEKLKALSDVNSDAHPSKRMEESKLARDFQAVLQEFQKVHNLAAEREATFAPAPSPSPSPSSLHAKFHSSGSEENSMADEEQQSRMLLLEQKRQEVLSLDNEIAFNEAILGEREQGIKDIQYDIGQINEIYKDLASLLYDQRGTIDNIDQHVEQASTSTAQAKAQLRNTSKINKSRSLWSCWVLIVFVAVLVIFLVFLIIH